MAPKLTPAQAANSFRLDARQTRTRVASALQAVGVATVGLVRRGFNESTDPFGKPWAPLKYRQGKPLIDRGILMASFTYRVGGPTVRIGTVVPYASIHNTGGVTKFPERQRKPPQKPWVFTTHGGQTVFTYRIAAHSVTIPRRTMLAWSERWLKAVNEVALKVLTKALGSTK
jgi:phage gpG-like protein